MYANITRFLNDIQDLYKMTIKLNKIYCILIIFGSIETISKPIIRIISQLVSESFTISDTEVQKTKINK